MIEYSGVADNQKYIYIFVKTVSLNIKLLIINLLMASCKWYRTVIDGIRCTQLDETLGLVANDESLHTITCVHNESDTTQIIRRVHNSLHTIF